MTRLSEGLEHKLTLISASAGAGKTTLLCEWSESPHGREVPLIWVSLDEGDNDPSRFWGYVCAALQPLHSGVSDLTAALLQGPAPPPMNYVLTTLINMLDGGEHDFVLVLDDYHVINTPSIHQDVTFLLGRLPQPMHVFLLTRSDPPLPLARLRGRGHLLELRAADLRCTIGEAEAFLNDVMGLRVLATWVIRSENRSFENNYPANW
jgi:LuxR family transcriptional regulator, maltose regulon positive regulatory protein